MKKITGILFAIVLIIISTVSVIAEDEIALSDKQREAVSLLNDIGIYENIDDEKAVTSVTRGEFAKLLVRMIGESELNENPRRIYVDVMPDNDAAASIELLYDKGIMIGYGDAEFAPDEGITAMEAAKAMISITGYANRAELMGGYPNGYYSIASSNGFMDGVSVSTNGQITYADLAVMFKNVLESKKYLIIDGVSKGYITEKEAQDKDYMGYVLGIYQYRGTVEGYGNTFLESPIKTTRDDSCIIGGEQFVNGTRDMSIWLGLNVKVYYREGYDGYEMLHIASDKNNEVLEVSSEDIEEDTTLTKLSYSIDSGRMKNARISPDAIFVYNGKRLEIVTEGELLIESGSVRLINNNGDSEYDIVIIKEYTTFIVEKAIITDSELLFKYGKGTLDLDDGTVKAAYYMDGAETDFSSISNGSVLSIAMSRNTRGDILADIYISNNQVTGTLKSTYIDGNRKGVVLEDDTVYLYTADFMTRLEEGEGNTYEPSFGETGTYYIDYFNQCAAYVVDATLKEYAYVVKCWYDEEEEKAHIRLFLKDGTFENFVISDKIKVNDKRAIASDVPELLKTTGTEGGIYQLIVYTPGAEGEVAKIQIAESKLGEPYYIAAEDEFVLNAYPKNTAGVPCGVRFYKNMAVDYPYAFVDGKTIQFLIPTDKSNEKAYKIATKLSSSDESVPAPVYIYDSGKAGNIGAIVTNTANEGKYSNACVVDKVYEALDEEGEICTVIQFVSGISVYVGDDVIYDQPNKNTNWQSLVDYSNVTVNDLKRGDVIEYTTSNNRVEMLRVIVKTDNIGPIRTDGETTNIVLNGNMIADVISVSDNGRTALVHYMNSDGDEKYQPMIVNGTVYRYDSSDKKVYSSSTADIREGDRILINSFWWSPKVVVIFR